MCYNLNFFNFKENENDVFLTNDFGNFIFLNKKDFYDLINHKLNNLNSCYFDLLKLGFIYENKENFLIKFTDKLKKNKNYLFSRTKLHIFALTNKCNLGCIYCQAKSSNSKNKMMSREDALKFVNIALSSSEQNLDFEFQGGEPTLNFQRLKDIFYYSEKNKNDKIIKYNLVTNLYSISDKEIDFLVDNNISISTSIDGNSQIHNFNRISLCNNSFENLKANFLKIKNKYIEKNLTPNIGAIQTTTKKSLPYAKEIIDTFLELGLDGIFLRPLSPIGNSILNWNKIGYTPEEFLKFYKEVLAYIINLNKNGISFKENNTVLFLKRIFQNDKLNYMELRSPCGAVIGQMAYNYDGNIYSCDEGRMLKELEDESFKIGNSNSNFNELIENPISKSLLASSCLEAIPSCQSCAYQPYCGTCPVYNYVSQKNIFGKQPENYRCKINSGILDHIFSILKNNTEESSIIISWLT
ncbi:His-Xaa-Ser system radical SAM maturase HxsB [Fusobacterium varium]|uniref:His-Xaa-Ser system radical SAM maturase HxsB n=1 Tax=Fusobacterium varium TaxID=856 RepID=UPI003562476E